MPKYRAQCTGNALAVSKEKGTPSVKLSFVAFYEHGDPTKPVDKQMYADLWLSEKAMNRTLDTLFEVFGWSDGDLDELNTKNELLAGIEVDLVTEWETYNGKPYEKVKFVNAPGKGSITRMEDASAANVAKNLKGVLLAHRQSKKSQGVAPPKVERTALSPEVKRPSGTSPVTPVVGGNPADSDDLPF